MNVIVSPYRCPTDNTVPDDVVCGLFPRLAVGVFLCFHKGEKSA